MWSNASCDKAWISYVYYLFGSGYLCFSMRNEKHIKALSDQQCSE